MNDAVREGGETYFRYRLAEMLPQIAPAMANALAESKAAATTGDGNGSPGPGVNGLISIIQSVLADQSAARSDTPNLAQADGVARALAMTTAVPIKQLSERSPEAPTEQPAAELRVRPVPAQRRASPSRKR